VIRVITLAELDEDTLAAVLRRLENTYGVGAEFAKAAPLPSGAYDAKADAYDAAKLVELGERVATYGDDKIVYLVERSLFVAAGPMGTGPVDGFAAYGGNRAVATAAGVGKLGKEAPGTPVFAKRAARQAGYLFGLHTCHDKRCLMLPAWAEGFVENPDALLCAFCREKSEKRIAQT
jgi:predicted Zn-dependent protease